MKIKRIKKSIDIKAPREKVWDILLNDRYTRIWYAEFAEGTQAHTDWKEGSKAVFMDPTQNGLISKVTRNKQYEVLAMEYVGIMNKGKEDYDSQMAKGIKGGIESYSLSGTDGSTNLYIESDMGEDFYESMSSSWEKALRKVKQLAEEK